MKLDGLGFGRLIKTIIPGILCAIACAGYLDLVAQSLDRGAPALAALREYPASVATVGLPASVALGILLNMLVFTSLTTRLVRVPFAKSNPAVVEFERKLAAHARDTIAPELRPPIAVFDLEAMMLVRSDLTKLLFLQDSYWYYLEFQLNLMIVAVFATPLVLARTALGAASLGVPWPVRTLLIVAFGFGLLSLVRYMQQTARVNYARYKSKLVTILATHLSDAAAPQSSDLHALGAPHANLATAPRHRHGLSH